MTAALRCTGLGHRYGRRFWGLRDCRLDVPAGRVVALVGPNGSGKTTLMSMAAGLLPVTEGKLESAGGPPARRLDRIGFVAQDAPLWPRLRVADVLDIGRCMNGDFDAVMAAERVRRLGIRPRARISALSGGERAQVALTLVLAKKPELFLLDEPMANLDPLARREFLGSMFDACQQTGATVLYSSHAVSELERVCDYLVLLRAGRVCLAGDIDELRQRHRVIRGPDGWLDGGGWPVVSQRSLAGQTTALVRCDDPRLPGPGLHDAAPTFADLVLGYLDGEAAGMPAEAAA
ncbi:MAG TPA: ABC transporter ATP-binding protein [Trebonia sp.]|nr:ABC transporter ATP-binding protein [Trebonia sp.]